MPRGRGATRPGRGSGARDRAHPRKKQSEAVGQHAMNVGWWGWKVKATDLGAMIEVVNEQNRRHHEPEGEVAARCFSDDKRQPSPAQATFLH
jgi:hypothetical protein